MSALLLSSGRAQPGDLCDGRDESDPVVALGRERRSPLAGDAVVAAATLPGTLDPAATDQIAILEAIERRIERGEREPQRPV